MQTKCNMEQYRVNKVWVDDAHIWLEIDENLCFEDFLQMQDSAFIMIPRMKYIIKHKVI